MWKRLFRWAKGLNDKIKFLFVGCLNTGISTVVYLLIMLCFGYGAFRANPDAPFYAVFVSTLAGQLLGLVNSYFWNKFFTFDQQKKNGWELVRFLGVYAVTYVVDYGLKYGIRRLFVLPEIVLVLIVLCFTTVISYFGQRYFVFQKSGRPQPPKEEGGEEKDDTK